MATGRNTLQGVLTKRVSEIFEKNGDSGVVKHLLQSKMLTGGFSACDESYLRHALAVVRSVCFDRRFSAQTPEIQATYPHIHDRPFHRE